MTSNLHIDWSLLFIEMKHCSFPSDTNSQNKFAVKNKLVFKDNSAGDMIEEIGILFQFKESNKFLTWIPAY